VPRPVTPHYGHAVTEADLRAEVAAHEWYHTLELAPGLLTPGWFDTRSVIDDLPFPADLSGRRCLDVGTFDGFWAFSMEQRGAAEVVAIDILDPRRWDWPPGSPPEVLAEIGKRKAGGAGFDLAHRALGSAVERRELSVYDLDPDDIGRFDFVYVGSLLLHLRDPVRALERVRSVCSGEVLLVDAVDLALTIAHPRTPVASFDGLGRPWWWKPNVAGFVRMARSAGLEPVGRAQRFFMPAGAGQQHGRVRPRRLLDRQGRQAAFMAWKGDPHAALRARPR
jgi:tRNA (mo5U34)-methyltransferase